jgi:hypothetical protein
VNRAEIIFQSVQFHSLSIFMAQHSLPRNLDLNISLAAFMFSFVSLSPHGDDGIHRQVPEYFIIEG